MATPDTSIPTCERIEGSGCASDELPRCTPEEDTGEDTGDTGPAEVTGRPCAFDGCEHAPGAPGTLALLVVLAVLRRARPSLLGALLAAALLGTAAPAAAEEQTVGVDAQHLQTLDGGTFPALREATAGRAWEPAVALSTHYGTGLVNLVDPVGRRPLLQEVLTTDLAASIRLAGLVRVGVGVPVHTYARYRYAPLGPRLGNVAVWAQVPMLDTEEGMGLGWYVQADVGSGAYDVYLGDPEGGIDAIVALSQRFGDWEVLGNLGARLASVTPVPGINWGVRGKYGVGVHRRIVSRLVANVELFGSVSLPPDKSPGDAPLEVLGTVGWDLGRGVVVHAGGGTGLTTGVGSPATRALLMVDVRRRAYPDRDKDGIIDVRDRCVDVPEDLDDLADADGCPEEDLDGDGIPDVADACPRDPETYNGWLDREGCPDVVTEVVFTVSGDEPVEQATIAFAEVDTFVLVGGERASVVLPPGRYEVKAEAEGFHPYSAWLAVPPGEPFAYTIPLEARRFGEVSLRVTDPAEVPLDGYLRRDGPLELLPKEGRVLTLPAGLNQVLVQAPGYLPRSLSFHVNKTGRTEVVAALQPSDLRVVGSRIETAQQVRFPLDKAEIPPDGEGPLDDLAALLLADQRIELLRIEGHADERGTSRYNLELSRRRAEAIRDWLVKAGVGEERLEAIGTGEARPARDGEAASRRVEFTVLVWADADGSAAPDAPDAP